MLTFQNRDVKHPEKTYGKPGGIFPQLERSLEDSLQRISSDQTKDYFPILVMWQCLSQSSKFSSELVQHLN
jgi:hypothetical protein